MIRLTMLRTLLDSIQDEGPNLPNRFTLALGKLVRKARLEANMSQSDLAEAAYLKQSSISRIEDGTRALSTEEVLYLSYALDKPIMYFFPKEFRIELDESELTTLEKELLIQVRQLDQKDLKKLIVQAKALAEFEVDR